MIILKFLGTIILWVLALILSTGKANFLIAGYNTSSKEEQEKYDGKALSKYMAKLCFVLGIIMLAVPLSDVLNIGSFNVVFWGSNVAFIVVIIGSIIYMNTGNKFQK